MRISRLITVLLPLLLLSGCNAADQMSSVLASQGDGGGVTGASAGVAAEEPTAARAGARILAEGGSAADAATAIYFALAVTDPAAAGLGGGGVCLVHDRTSGRNEEFDFLPRAPQGGGSFAIPGNVRGFVALQSAFGTIAWSRDIVPAERLASFGFEISAVLENQLAASLNAIRLDANLAGLFLDESGQVKKAGTTVVLSDLAMTLADIRTEGQRGLYGGAIGARIVSYASAQGGAIALNDLDGFSVVTGEPPAKSIERETLLLPDAKSGAATFASSVLGAVAGASDVHAALRTAILGLASATDDKGATGFVTRDASGQTVGCAVTMNGAFGSGRTAPGTGITLALGPGAAGGAPVAAGLLAPFLLVDNDGDATLSGAAAGTVDATTRMVVSIVHVSRGENALPAAAPNTSGSLDMILCARGTCRHLPDPRGSGLGISVGK